MNKAVLALLFEPEKTVPEPISGVLVVAERPTAFMPEGVNALTLLATSSMAETVAALNNVIVQSLLAINSLNKTWRQTKCIPVGGEDRQRYECRGSLIFLEKR